MPSTDPVADRLSKAPILPAVRADAWDAFQQATDEDDLAARLRALKMPDSVKADLWDLKQQESAASQKSEKPRVGATGSWEPESFALGDVLRGVRAGAASTVFHGGDLIRRGLGMERVIETPEVQAGITPPESTAGTIGYGAEQIAEFAVPLARVAQAVKGAPMLARMAVEGATGGGVAGFQSQGDPTMTTAGTLLSAAMPVAGAVLRPVFDGIKRAAAGAQEGGLGGAIAAGVRAIAPGEPRQLLVQALKPRSTQSGFHSALDRALPWLKSAESDIGKPITTVDELIDAAKSAKKKIQAQLNVMRGSSASTQINLSSVGDAMVESIPKKLQLENPAAALRLKETADVYRRGFALDEAETLLRETNAELEGFYNMYPQAQRQALRSNAGVAALEAQAKALRQAIYGTLDVPGGGAAARDLNRQYGALMEVEDTAIRRSNVARRQQPESLSEQIGAVRAAADLARGTWRMAHGDLTGAADIAAAHAGRATAKAIKESQTTDALIRRAFQKYRGQPVSVIMPPPRRPVRGELPPGPMITPQPADESFVRSVPAEFARRPVRGELPPYREPIITPQPSHGEVRSVRARSIVQRDPRTGRMRRIYIGESASSPH